MATDINYSNVAGALKRLYRDERVRHLAMVSNPLFGILPKAEDFGGDSTNFMEQYGDPQGRSADFTSAQANRTQHQLAQFRITHVNDHKIVRATGEAIDATRTKGTMAFMEVLQRTFDRGLKSFAKDVEVELYRDGSGQIGQISAGSDITTATITLAEPKEVHNFEIGQVLNASVDTATSQLRTADASVVTLTAVNRITGQLTASGNWNAGIAAIAAGDYLFVQGDAWAYGTDGFKKMRGLLAWVPTAAPSSAAFFGVDRSVDTRLYGLFYDGSALPVNEALLDAAVLASEHEGVPDLAICHYIQLRGLLKEIGVKQQYLQETVQAMSADGPMADIGYEAVKIHGGKKPLRILASAYCQPETGWVLQPPTWLLESMGQAIRVNRTGMDGGQNWLRVSDGDSAEIRFVKRAQMSTDWPNGNVNVTLKPVST